MKSKIIIIISAFLFFPLCVCGQEAVSQAKALFAEGNYSEAAQLYEMAASLTDNTAQRENLYSLAKQAGKCASLLSSGENAMRNRNYESAASSFSQLLKINPKDKTASNGLSKCNKFIAKAKAEAESKAKAKAEAEARAAIMQIIDNPYSANAKKLVNDKPDSDMARCVVAIRKKNKLPVESDILLYLQIGRIYEDKNDVNSAILWYDRAAVFGNTEALYREAVLNIGQNRTDVGKTAMILSAVGGYAPAIEAIAAAPAGQYSYDKEVAARMIRHLQNYRKDIESALYVYTNYSNYPFAIQCGLIPYEYRNVRHYMDNYSDHFNFQYGKMLKELRHDATTVMMASAQKGNLSAMSWLQSYADSEEIRKLFFDSGLPVSDGKKAYIKYLKEEKMTASEYELMYGYLHKGSNKVSWLIGRDNYWHDLLVSGSLQRNSDVNMKLYKKKVFDSKIINFLHRELQKRSDKGAAKSLRKIKKLKKNSRSNVYDARENMIYRQIQLGCYDNRHAAIDVCKKESLFL